jgi:HPr kinase/phosphorylase
MSKHVLVHGTCVALGGKGVLLLGGSGAGKSDLALRLIHDGAVLVADDRVVLTVKASKLAASAPTTIAGLIEVRGLGILKLPVRAATLALAVQLGDEGPRLPGEDRWTPEGLKAAPSLPLLYLDGRHASDPAKIAFALKAFAKGLFRDTFAPK